MPSRRNIRIPSVSGATDHASVLTANSGDAPHAMRRMVEAGDVDVITGDWLSEMNIAWESLRKAACPTTGYDMGFFDQLEESIDQIHARKLKVITNAGAMNPSALAGKVETLCRSRGLELTVATVLGDDVSYLLEGPASKGRGQDFMHLDHAGERLEDWDDDLIPSGAIAYIGAWGITAALQAGADIVICGRVTDASPVIGAAAWWYNWSRTSYDELAGALIAGHLIECGPYATGANFSGFKEFLPSLVDLAFPVAEILPSGECLISKPESMAGFVNKFNITAQLLYELQGELYLNPDVVADIKNIQVEETSIKDCVRVWGAIGLPPPETTKVMIAAPGGFQAETTYYLNGLDIQAKAQMMKQQLENVFEHSNFSKLSVELYGGEATDPRSQQAGTAMLRVFAQARRKEDLVAEKFRIPIYSLRMQSYPGNIDPRLA
ncbi:hypothetical protein KVT40_001778 [Elsinoe batatas]|uniref:Acyclic terpene utilisation N-terminal domain-containing protein n=1 Tax=Elsinoe batatas TaxID=2601811 RepID=A0A8K0L7Z3_9PEZI|nr:hypothetical protein KVT40_001778 [Elsinoe batatas]